MINESLSQRGKRKERKEKRISFLLNKNIKIIKRKRKTKEREAKYIKNFSLISEFYRIKFSNKSFQKMIKKRKFD